MPIASYFKRNPVQVIEQGATTIYAKLTVGSTGAVSADTGYGLTSIVRNGTGNYTITLDRKFKKLLSVLPTVIQATPQGLKMTLESDDIAASGAITLEWNTDGGTATELSSGTIVIFAITVADTSLTGGI
jgi:hypothetical protein